MVAGGTVLKCFFPFVNVTTLAALPLYLFVAFENFFLLNIFD